MVCGRALGFEPKKEVSCTLNSKVTCLTKFGRNSQPAAGANGLLIFDVFM